MNLLRGAEQAFRFTAEDRFLAVSTLSFDISVVEVLLPLICGGTVVIGNRRLLLERGAVAATIRRDDVTVFQTGPSVWALLLDGLTPFPRLRVAVTTGEAIAPTLAERLRPVADIVWNLYGPTETTIWCAGHRLDPAGSLDGSTAASAPIGLPGRTSR